MSLDVAALAAFYETPLGRLSQASVARVLRRLWPEVKGLSLMGLGFATPFLPLPSLDRGRVFAFMPAWQGVTPWPTEPGRARSCCLVDPTTMPLQDECVDRILIVHALETVESPVEFLYEAERVLSPSGRIIVICPNRRGLWARRDTTPFGQGQPFSRSQLRALLRTTGLKAESWAETLYMPPFGGRLMLSTAAAWETLGATLSLPFAGLHVMEAVKQIPRPEPVRAKRRASRPWPVMVPVPASRETV